MFNIHQLVQLEFTNLFLKKAGKYTAFVLLDTASPSELHLTYNNIKIQHEIQMKIGMNQLILKVLFTN